MNHWLALHSIPGIGAATFNRLLERFGEPAKVFSASFEELIKVPNLPQSIIDNILSGKNSCNTSKILSELKFRQFKIITKYAPDYPDLLKKSTIPPPIIYTYGELRFTKSIAIIGASQPSQTGLQASLRFAKTLAQKGFTIVSGYAKGVDTYAHLGTILGGEKTIMVLPFGVLNFLVHKELAPMSEKLFSQSVIFSEFFPTAIWTTGQAMIRNRRISELSKAVIVIEAGKKGGTIATARWAKKLNKPIFIYKGISNPRNKELFELGAIPVGTPEEVLSKVK